MVLRGLWFARVCDGCLGVRKPDNNSEIAELKLSLVFTTQREFTSNSAITPKPAAHSGVFLFTSKGRKGIVFLNFSDFGVLEKKDAPLHVTSSLN